MLEGLIDRESASAPRRRAVSSEVPVPRTWEEGRPDSLRAKWVRMSTGLATKMRIVCGERGDMEVKIEERMWRLRLRRERRDSPVCCQYRGNGAVYVRVNEPGFCFAPAVMTTMSA